MSTHLLCTVLLTMTPMYDPILGSDSPADSEYGIRSLLANNSKSSLEYSASDSIALSARLYNERSSKSDSEKTSGFFEGILRFRLPKWWCLGLKDSKLRKKQPGSLFQISTMAKDQEWNSSQYTYSIKGGSIYFKGKTIITQHMLKEYFTLSSHGTDYLALTHSGSNVYLMLYNDVATVNELHCFDCEEAKPKWTAKIWSDSLSTILGVHYNYMELYADGNYVTALGASSQSSFVETIRSLDGRAKLRASSSFWGFAD